MEETPNERKFKEYKDALDKAGVPVGPEFAAETEKEMEWGMREEGLTFGGKTEYDPRGVDWNVEKKFKTKPKRELTGFTVEQLQRESRNLSTAREVFLFLENIRTRNPKITDRTTLYELSDMGEKILGPKIWEAVNIMQECGIDEDVPLSNCVREIRQRIAQNLGTIDRLRSEEDKLRRTSPAAEDLKNKMKGLSAAKDVIKHLPNIKNFKVTKKTTLYDLEATQIGIMKGEIIDAIATLEDCKFPGDTLLSDTPKKIEEKINEYYRNLQDVQRKPE